MNTTLIKADISDALDKQPEVLWNQETCKQAFEQKVKKTKQTSQGLELWRVEKSTGPPTSHQCFFIMKLSLYYTETGENERKIIKSILINVSKKRKKKSISKQSLYERVVEPL